MKSILRHLFRIVAVAALLARASHAAEPAEPSLPTLFLIGDSTVNNPAPGQQGWGMPFAAWLDSHEIHLDNRARGGRSSRSYLREGLWTAALAEMHAGDFVLIQFGHNDGGPLDSEKARASLKGTGPETREVTIKETGVKEVVRTFGGYLRQYIEDAKAKGATPIVFSLPPRNIWVDGKIARNDKDYALWAAETAAAENVPFINLNALVADRYEKAGQEKVATEYFTATDHTHTSPAGAALVAECVVEALLKLPGSPLAKYLLTTPTPLTNPTSGQ